MNIEGAPTVHPLCTRTRVADVTCQMRLTCDAVSWRLTSVRLLGDVGVRQVAENSTGQLQRHVTFTVNTKTSTLVTVLIVHVHVCG